MKDKELYAAFMGLDKTYDKADRQALWNVLIYRVEGQLIKGIITFYREVNECVKVDWELSDSFAGGVGVRQGCVMSSWLLNIFMDSVSGKWKLKWEK